MIITLSAIVAVIIVSMAWVMVAKVIGERKPQPSMKMGNPNEKLMLTFGLGVVLAWVVIAATASYFSIVEERDISDSQLTVIGGMMMHYDGNRIWVWILTKIGVLV